MKKNILFFTFLVFFFSSYCFSQSTIDLSDISDKKTQTQKTDEKKSEKQDVKKSTDTKKNQKESKTKTKPDQKNGKSKKPLKKNGKNYKYKFEKKEEAVYKFDEKGNPIIPKAKIIKSTSTKKSNTDFSIGVEDREVNLKDKGK